jgi:beta-phosphoglucomutase
MQAVLFDFDGVVIRSMEDHFEGWRKALQEYDIEMSPEELYIMEGAGVEELASQLTRKFNLPFEEKLNIIQKKHFYYDQIKKTEFYPDLIEVLQWIQEKGLKTGLVTGGGRERVIEDLESFGLKDRFNVIVTADDVLRTKPSPEPYLIAARLIGVEPGECVVIENAPLGIQSAKSAGMRCIAVATTLSPMYLKAADVVADNLEVVLESLKRMY